MTQAFKLQAANIQQIVTVPGGIIGSATAFVGFDAPPSAGTVTIEYRQPGSAIWQSLVKATAASLLTGEFAARVDGDIAAFRITFAGLVGGISPALWVTQHTMPTGLFNGLSAMTVQNYPEANVKNGLQYNIRASWPLADAIAAGTARKIWVKTTTKPLIVKLRDFQYVAEELRLELFRSPTGVTLGTDLAVHNYNNVNPVATTIQAKKNVTVANNGTAFDTADSEYFFGSANSPQRQSASAFPSGRERILAANTEFVVVITNTGTDSARAQYFLDFYEGGTDLPL